jgi:hypothetical protein
MPKGQPKNKILTQVPVEPVASLETLEPAKPVELVLSVEIFSEKLYFI